MNWRARNLRADFSLLFLVLSLPLSGKVELLLVAAALLLRAPIWDRSAR